MDLVNRITKEKRKSEGKIHLQGTELAFFCPVSKQLVNVQILPFFFCLVTENLAAACIFYQHLTGELVLIVCPALVCFQHILSASLLLHQNKEGKKEKLNQSVA